MGSSLFVLIMRFANKPQVCLSVYTKRNHRRETGGNIVTRDHRHLPRILGALAVSISVFYAR